MLREARKDIVMYIIVKSGIMLTCDVVTQFRENRKVYDILICASFEQSWRFPCNLYEYHAVWGCISFMYFVLFTLIICAFF
jgi:hypothetical protein